MRVFISHEDNDRPVARKLSEALRSVGIEPRTDDLKIACGDDHDCIREELRKRYDYMVALLSPSYLNSPFLYNELIIGLTVEYSVKPVKPEFVIPILLADCSVPSLLDRKLIDLRKLSFDEGFAKLRGYLGQSRQVFVIMKFGDENLDSAYELAISPVVKEFGYSVLRIDKVQDSGQITDQVLNHIDHSSVVLADLTGGRPNCYFEVGYALALGKELVLSAHEGDPLHFDVAGRRFIRWRTPSQLHDALQLRFDAIREKNKASVQKIHFQS